MIDFASGFSAQPLLQNQPDVQPSSIRKNFEGFGTENGGAMEINAPNFDDFLPSFEDFHVFVCVLPPQPEVTILPLPEDAMLPMPIGLVGVWPATGVVEDADIPEADDDSVTPNLPVVADEPSDSKASAVEENLTEIDRKESRRDHVMAMRKAVAANGVRGPVDLTSLFDVLEHFDDETSRSETHNRNQPT